MNLKKVPKEHVNSAALLKFCHAIVWPSHSGWIGHVTSWVPNPSLHPFRPGWAQAIFVKSKVCEKQATQLRLFKRNTINYWCILFFCLPVHMFFNLKRISFFKFCDHILMLYLIEIFALPTVNQLKSDFRKHMETSKICRPKKTGANIILLSSHISNRFPARLGWKTTTLHLANAPGVQTKDTMNLDESLNSLRFYFLAKKSCATRGWGCFNLLYESSIMHKQFAGIFHLLQVKWTLRSLDDEHHGPWTQFWSVANPWILGNHHLLAMANDILLLHSAGTLNLVKNIPLFTLLHSRTLTPPPNAPWFQ